MWPSLKNSCWKSPNYPGTNHNRAYYLLSNLNLGPLQSRGRLTFQRFIIHQLIYTLCYDLLYRFIVECVVSVAWDEVDGEADGFHIPRSSPAPEPDRGASSAGGRGSGCVLISGNNGWLINDI